MFLQKNNPSAPPLEYGAISKEDLLQIGADSICYLKPGTDDGVSIYNASGVLLMREESVKDARHSIRGKQLSCVTLH